MRHIGWLDRGERLASAAVTALAGLGAAIVVVQVFWISYGVFMRYVVNNPDMYVTEATALLLVPVAFAGLGYALKTDAYPKVTLLVERLPPRAQRALAIVNTALMMLIGLFFAIAAVSATMRSYANGSASEVLSWPRFYFWAPAAASLVAFVALALLRLVRLVVTPQFAGEE